MKKAQSSIEFLMTYGWVILIVIIAIGTITYSGVLKSENFLQDKCLISFGSGLFCEDFTATTGSVVVRLKNVGTEEVSISSITTDKPSCVTSESGVILPDESSDIILSCEENLEQGEKIKSNVNIDYQIGNGLLKTTKGEIVTKTVPFQESHSKQETPNHCDGFEHDGCVGIIDSPINH